MLQEFQMKIWNQIYNNPILLKKYRNLISPGMFTVPPLQMLTDVLLRMWDQYGKIPEKDSIYSCLERYTHEAPSQAALLPIYQEYLNQIKPEEAFSYDYLLELLRDRAYEDLKRVVEDAVLKKEYDKILMAVINAEEIMEKGEDKIIYKFSEKTYDQFLDLYQKEYIELPKLQTGLQVIDNSCGGGIARGKIATLLAPTSFGKTSFLVMFGHKARQMGFFVLHITLEESLLDTALRYYQTAIGHKVDPFLTTETALQDSIKLMGLGDLWILDKGTTNLSDISTWIRRVKNEINPQNLLVIIDYADLISMPNKKFEAERFRSTEIFTFLTTMAKKENIWLWTACQANRKSAFKQIIRVEDIAEDYNKARLSSYVFSICCNEEEEKLNIRRIFVAKNRFGRRFNVDSVRVKWDSLSTEELTKEEKEAQDSYPFQKPKNSAN